MVRTMNHQVFWSFIINMFEILSFIDSHEPVYTIVKHVPIYIDDKHHSRKYEPYTNHKNILIKRKKVII